MARSFHYHPKGLKKIIEVMVFGSNEPVRKYFSHRGRFDTKKESILILPHLPKYMVTNLGKLLYYTAQILNTMITFTSSYMRSGNLFQVSVRNVAIAL